MTSTGAASYACTANGELLTRTGAGGTTAYGYDGLGNLLSVTLPDGTLISYQIDGRNRRVAREPGGGMRYGFLYSGKLAPVATLDGGPCHPGGTPAINGPGRTIPDNIGQSRTAKSPQPLGNCGLCGLHRTWPGVLLVPKGRLELPRGYPH
ncbi:MAG: RHS repeat protein [Nitrospirota bacterium]|nr:RHS repeat protein [Nitrospirota bacterium]